VSEVHPDLHTNLEECVPLPKHSVLLWTIYRVSFGIIAVIRIHQPYSETSDLSSTFDNSLNRKSSNKGYVSAGGSTVLAELLAEAITEEAVLYLYADLGANDEDNDCDGEDQRGREYETGAEDET
jgi:hypothetical protein